MTIGKNIKEIRQARGMTQAQLADLLGVTPAMISQYENNPNPPKIGTLEKIASALNVGTYDLALNEDDKLQRIPDLIEYIKAIKKRIRYTENDIAEATGIDISMINKILSSTNPELLNFTTVQHICDKLGFIDDMVRQEKMYLQQFAEYKEDQLFNNEQRSGRKIDLQQFAKDNESKLLDNYNKLNDIGKQEAEKRVEELTYIEKYTKKD